jgi:hemerythrin-like domain-containing protein
MSEPLGRRSISALVTLRARSSGEPKGDVVGLLLDCHERIRRFSEMSVQLACAKQPSAPEIREAAERVHRYFTVAFPLHVADEELSLRPRLLERSAGQEIIDALDTMSREHVEGDALLEPLSRAWAALIDDPEREELRASSLDPANRLQVLLRDHLLLEERVLFPAVTRHLSAPALAEVVAEMRGRRTTGDSKNPG